MPVHNNDIAKIFNKVADLLDLEDANQFRVRAYRNAAGSISSLSRNIGDMVEEGKDLSQLPGIGESMAEKIEEIIETGTLSQLAELEQETPEELTELMKLGDLGPKRVQQLHEELDIESMNDLEEAAREGDIESLEGFGEKTQEKIIEEIERRKESGDSERTKLAVAEEITHSLLDYLRQASGVKNLEIAGSFRRRKETVGDIDILATCKQDSNIMERFTTYEDVERVISKGDTRSSVVLRTGMQVDLRVVPRVSYGAALVYFTGSKSHNVTIRKLGQKKNLKINEYGVFKNDDRVAGKTENEIYEQIDLVYIPPELREDRGEIEAARKDRLPDLITVDDIRGDLQTHTNATDGKFSLEDMAKAAREKGYEYYAVTDHSKRVTMANGLDEKRLAEQIEEIDALNEEFDDFLILKSVECDILKDGTLDLDDNILKELDLVVCSIHYNLNLSRDKQTERVLRAMDNPYFNIFVHPTGRRIGQREPYEIDLEKVMKKAKDAGCILEVNAQPERLDLNDTYCKMAKDMGIKLAISTDAHTKTDFDFMRFGVAQSRRGWLEPQDVINTRNLREIKKLLKRN